VPEVTDFAGEYVKEAFLSEKPENYESVDLRIALKLKVENRAFRIEKYEHNYPHCWRTDKPILYYPLDSWFIRTTALKPRLLELNSEIRWKPESTGTGRFGHWLENLVDWNLSRSRFWGIPLPIWRSRDGSQVVCIGSVQELMDAVDKSVSAGLMERNPFVRKADGSPDLDAIDLHRHVVDAVVLAGENNEPLYRENDLIDVWFDSGAMPYAQWHYPFENKELIDSGKAFPADFIAEGVDQTRGWFFTLHVIAAGVFDSVAYKSVISNGLVLDKFGQKMSKRLGNAVDPFVTMEQHGADALRWYMICNAAPWENLKFDEAGIDEVKRKFLGTLYNTYGFFALYANVDGVNASELKLPENAPVFDRWMLSRLRSLCTEVERLYEEYDLTQAGRAIQEFVTEELSNWYVRLSRRRFWKGEKNEDKLSAYYTLFHALDAVSKLMAPIAPFFADWLYTNLHQEREGSVHLALWPDGSRWESLPELESAMDTARSAVSLALSLRKKERIRVRQPLQRMLIPMQGRQNVQWEEVGDLIRTEVNVKELEFISADSGFLVKQAKADFKKLGPKYGKQMKALGALISGLSSEQIVDLESIGSLELDLEGGESERVIGGGRDCISGCSWLGGSFGGEFNGSIGFNLNRRAYR
jgi:isoleucyl-tRNA synthetase